MPFSRPTLSQLRASVIQDVVAVASNAGSLLRNSILRILATVQAQLAHAHYGFLDWISRQAVPSTSEDEYLEAWAALRGVTRILAKTATGSATISGLTGGYLPSGSRLRSPAGVEFLTVADLTLTVATGVVAIRAVDAGIAGNLDIGTALTLTAPRDGLSSAAVVASPGTSGGTDDETDTALRVRMLDRYARPPQGGSLADYEGWAKEVGGVTRAWARALPAGGGTVALYFVTDLDGNDGFPSGTGGAATMENRDGAKATGEVQTVASYVHTKRPVTALVTYWAPAAQPINVTLSLSTGDSPDARVAIAAAIRAMLVREGTALGGFIYQSQVEDAISSVPALGPFTLTSPTSPVMTSIGSIPVLGTVTYT